jgi:hypothetical protein
MNGSFGGFLQKGELSVLLPESLGAADRWRLAGAIFSAV